MPFLFLAIPLAFVTLLPIIMYQQVRQARSIADTPTSRIRSAVQGYVELTGTSPAIGISPLSNTPACFWRLTATRSNRLPRGGAGAAIILRAGAPHSFLPLDDSTGICLISLAEAEIDGITTTWDRVSRADRRALASLFPVDTQELLLQDGDWTIKETMLPADRPLYALGRFTSCTTTEQPRDLDWVEAVLERGNKAPTVARLLARTVADRATQWRDQRTAEWARLARQVEGTSDHEPLRGTARLSVLTVDYEQQPPQPLLVSHRQESSVRQSRYLGLLPMGVAFLVFGLGGTVLAGWTFFPETTAALAGWVGLDPLLH